MEKFALITTPLPNPKESYNARQFAIRTRAAPLRSNKATDAWIAWFHEFQESEIRWTCPWWNISVFTTALLNECVQMAGLRQTSYYCPNRLRRQYYKRQEIPPTIAAFDTSTITRFFLSRISNAWPHRQIVAVTGVAEDVHTSDHYRAWVQKMRETSDPEKKKRVTATFFATKKRKRS